MRVTEAQTPTPEGAERLRHPRLLTISLEGERINLDTAVIYYFGIGTRVSQIDAESGEFIYDDEATASIKRTKKMFLYSPNAEGGEFILVQIVDRDSAGMTHQTNLFFVLGEYDWVTAERISSSVVV